MYVNVLCWFFNKYIPIFIHSGKCYRTPASRGNGYRVWVIPNSLNENNTWKSPNNQGKVYKHFYHHKRQDKELQRIVLEREFDSYGKGYRFIVRTVYEDSGFRYGCNPILRIQFMATESNKQTNCGTPGNDSVLNSKYILGLNKIYTLSNMLYQFWTFQ